MIIHKYKIRGYKIKKCCKMAALNEIIIDKKKLVESLAK